VSSLTVPASNPGMADDDVRGSLKLNQTVDVRRAVLVALLMTVGLLAGCTTTDESIHTPPISFVPIAGIRGLLVLQLRSQPNIVRPMPTAGVVMVFEGTRLVATVATGSSGKYSVHVPSGSYTLEGVPWRHISGAVACTGRAVVPKNLSVVANVECNFVNRRADSSV